MSKESSDSSIYSINNSIIGNNKHYQGTKVNPSKYPINENNVTKEGEISLRMIKNIFEPSPINHLHVIPNTLGYNIGAGLFKQRKQ